MGVGCALPVAFRQTHHVLLRFGLIDFTRFAVVFDSGQQVSFLSLFFSLSVYPVSCFDGRMCVFLDSRKWKKEDMSTHLKEDSLLKGNSTEKVDEAFRVLQMGKGRPNSYRY